MTKIIVLLCAALAYVAWNTKEKRNQSLAAHEFARSLASGEDSCSGKKFCVVVYVAPWCPACNAIAPRLRESVEKSKKFPDLGLRVVVGQGTPEQNEQEAASFGRGGSADQSGKVRKALDVHEFPSFFVLDQERTIILSGQEAWQWTDEKFN